MKNNLRRKLVISVVVLQMMFFAGWYFYESGGFSKPIATIKVRTLPYDPRDLLSGQYIRIRYTFSDGNTHRSNKKWKRDLKTSDGDVWVLLEENNGFFEPTKAKNNPPNYIGPKEVWIKGRKRRNRISYGIEKYFLPEGTPEPKREDETTVELNVYKNGKVRISRVFVNGIEWP